MKHHTFESLAVGDTISLGPYNVTREEVIEFASEFDPQPFHLDDAAAEASMLGKLSASGWHTCAMTMRMLCDAFLLTSSSQGSPGVDYCIWLHPVFPGDTLSGSTTVISKRESKSRPNIGFVELVHTINNQDGKTVLEMSNIGLMGKAKVSS